MVRHVCDLCLTCRHVDVARESSRIHRRQETRGRELPRGRRAWSPRVPDRPGVQARGIGAGNQLGAARGSPSHGRAAGLETGAEPTGGAGVLTCRKPAHRKTSDCSSGHSFRVMTCIAFSPPEAARPFGLTTRRCGFQSGGTSSLGLSTWDTAGIQRRGRARVRGGWSAGLALMPSQLPVGQSGMGLPALVDGHMRGPERCEEVYDFRSCKAGGHLVDLSSGN